MKKLLLLLALGVTTLLSAQVAPDGIYKLGVLGVNGSGVNAKGKVILKEGIFVVDFKNKSIPDMTIDLQLENPDSVITESEGFIQIIADEVNTYRIQKEQFTKGYSLTSIQKDLQTGVVYTTTISFKK
jgi:hypothetical protein